MFNKLSSFTYVYEIPHKVFFNHDCISHNLYDKSKRKNKNRSLNQKQVELLTS